MKTAQESMNCKQIMGVSVEARGGIEPPNKGFADHSDENAKPLESRAVVDDIASRPNVGPIDLTDAYALMCFASPKVIGQYDGNWPAGFPDEPATWSGSVYFRLQYPKRFAHGEIADKEVR